MGEILPKRLVENKRVLLDCFAKDLYFFNIIVQLFQKNSHTYTHTQHYM